jgi:hypothetical protein
MIIRMGEIGTSGLCRAKGRRYKTKLYHYRRSGKVAKD